MWDEEERLMPDPYSEIEQIHLLVGDE